MALWLYGIHFKTGLGEGVYYLFDMGAVAGFHLNVELAARNLGIGGVALVFHRKDVSSVFANHAAHL